VAAEDNSPFFSHTCFFLDLSLLEFFSPPGKRRALTEREESRREPPHPHPPQGRRHTRGGADGPMGGHAPEGTPAGGRGAEAIGSAPPGPVGPAPRAGAPTWRHSASSISDRARGYIGEGTRGPPQAKGGGRRPRGSRATGPAPEAGAHGRATVAHRGRPFPRGPPGGGRRSERGTGPQRRGPGTGARVTGRRGAHGSPPGAGSASPGRVVDPPPGTPRAGERPCRPLVAFRTADSNYGGVPARGRRGAPRCARLA